MFSRGSLITCCFILASGLLLAASPSSANPYVEGNVLYTNGADPDGNIGGSLSLGYGSGAVRAEIEASNHMHLSNGTLGIMGKGYVEPDWTVSPYLGIGAGYSFEDTLILTATVGASYGLTDILDIVGGYEHRWYGPISDFGDSEDSYLTLGLRVGF